MLLKKKCLLLINCFLLLAPSIPLVAATQPLTASNPLAIHYEMNRIEDYLEEKYDKKFKGNWDYDIVYHDEQISIRMEYDTKAKKALMKASTEELQAFIEPVIKKIARVMKRDILIDGMIIEEDQNIPLYTFMYKDDKLDIK